MILALAIGFLAGLLAYALFAPEQTPAPETAAPSASDKRAVKRDGTRTTPTRGRVAERASVPTRPAAGTAVETYRPTDGYGPATAGVYPDTAYGAPGTVGDTYRPTDGYGTDPAGAYPSAGYGPMPPAPGEERYGVDTWPSTGKRSAQKTFKQPLIPRDYDATRPWGNVDRSRRERPAPPTAQYPAYPMSQTPYGVRGDYPGSSVDMPGQQWGTEYYPSWGPPQTY